MALGWDVPFRLLVASSLFMLPCGSQVVNAANLKWLDFLIAIFRPCLGAVQHIIDVPAAKTNDIQDQPPTTET